MSDTEQVETSVDEVKIVISTSNSKVNGSIAGLIAVIFGEFGILKLYGEVPNLISILTDPNTIVANWRWWGLTLSYIVLGLLGLLFGYRAISYSILSARAGDRLSRIEEGILHQSTKEIFDILVEQMEASSGWDRKLKHWAIRQELWLISLFAILYILPFVAVAIRL